MRAWSVLTMLLVTASALASSPAEAVAAASADVARLTPEQRRYTRYFTTYAISPKARPDWEAKVLPFLVNMLSTEADLVQPRRVSAHVFAVDIRDYGWKKAVWERLAQVEPFFHARLKGNALEPPARKELTPLKPWPGGVWKADGVYYPPGAFQYQQEVTAGGTPPGKGGVVNALAPWLDARHIGYLVQETQSQVPIVRADWFLYQASIQKDRVAGYYDFLNLGKKQEDFEDLVGADREKARRRKSEIASIMARSGVTLQNRSVYRFGSIDGGYWVTVDFKQSVDFSNVIRNLDKDVEPPEGDASEQYGRLPNGLFAFWLQNGKRVRQDVAPDFIATNKSKPGNSATINVGMDCIRCHVEGLRPIDDFIRGVYENETQLATPNYERYKRLRQLYFSDLDDHLKKDNAAYAATLFKLTRATPAQMAKLFGDAWDAYAEADLDADAFAREMGVDAKFMVDAFRRQALGGLDPVLAGFIARKPRKLRREHADEVYGEAQKAVRGYRP